MYTVDDAREIVDYARLRGETRTAWALLSRNNVPPMPKARTETDPFAAPWL